MGRIEMPVFRQCGRERRDDCRCDGCGRKKVKDEGATVSVEGREKIEKPTDLHGCWRDSFQPANKVTGKNIRRFQKSA